MNDGSKDQSVNKLKQVFDLVEVPKFFEDSLYTQPIKAIYRSKSYPSIILLDKEHGKKSDALNAGINACTTHYFFGIDSDTLIDDHSFEACIRSILNSPETIAIGATISVNNDCLLQSNRICTRNFPQTFITAVQSLEYLRSFFIRQGWDCWGGNLIIAGAFCVFPKDLIIQAGGFIPSSGEDMEMTIRLHRIMKKRKIPYKIFYLPDPIAWTKVPSKWASLAKQRARWHTGLLESLFFHKSICFNPSYGLIAFFSYPFWLAGEALQPIMEIFGLLIILLSIALGVFNIYFFLVFIGMTFVFTFVFTLSCILIESLSFQRYPSSKTVLYLLFYALIENFGYRQLCLWWKIRGFGRFLKTFALVKKQSFFIKKMIRQSGLTNRQPRTQQAQS